MFNRSLSKRIFFWFPFIRVRKIRIMKLAAWIGISWTIKGHKWHITSVKQHRTQMVHQLWFTLFIKKLLEEKKGEIVKILVYFKRRIFDLEFVAYFCLFAHFIGAMFIQVKWLKCCGGFPFIFFQLIDHGWQIISFFQKNRVKVHARIQK